MKHKQSATASTRTLHAPPLSPFLLLLVRGGSPILIKKKMRKRFHFSQIGPHSSKGKGIKWGMEEEKRQTEKNKMEHKKLKKSIKRRRSVLLRTNNTFWSFPLYVKSPILPPPSLSLEKWQSKGLGPQRERDVTVIFPLHRNKRGTGRELGFPTALNGLLKVTSNFVLNCWRQLLGCVLKAFCTTH